MVVSLTGSQTGAVCGMRSQIPVGGKMWIHGELDSIFVEIEDAEARTIIQRRIWENGDSAVIKRGE